MIYKVHFFYIFGIIFVAPTSFLRKRESSIIGQLSVLWITAVGY